MPLHQFDYLFVIGTIFVVLNAWNIGANDVANAWASAVASLSISYIGAMSVASVMEFSGAVFAGAGVTDTIRNGIIDTAQFADNPPLLMLGMVCAVTASALCLTIATKVGMPVSSTHTLIGGLMGFGIAALGTGAVKWVADEPGVAAISSGVVQVFITWVIAPCLAGVFAALIFTITKFTVLLRQRPEMKGLVLFPVYFSATGSLIALLLLSKGGTIKVADEQVPAVVIGIGLGTGGLVALTLVPWLYRTAILDDWQLKWYDMWKGPFLLRRGPVPPNPSESSVPAERPRPLSLNLHSRQNSSDIESNVVKDEVTPVVTEVVPHKSLIGPKPDGPWHSKELLWWAVKFAVLHGVDKDVVNLQNEGDGSLSKNINEMHARSVQYDAKAEHLFKFLQVLTSATASFAHGANDVSNAIGPYTTIFEIWRDGKLSTSSEIPTWILVGAGFGIVVGLWTYGYNIMKNLGNKLTLLSPSRGFSIDVGSATTVILATKLGLPVSTTQCITGATVGVGLCNGDWRSINWRIIAFIYSGWIFTLPVAATLSGALMGFIINAPQ
ncbi:related to phosphate-repressible Na+/phosphate cotransporter Pho89 [Cephalotrichum gorgonifer]|uniref:Phosphate transporter n=1 Tax=Cephalotrichum gorgonifer TaxID=2041049 RepID=A0AAE8N7E5_9PEZI|nr:related to phosphate-repressible Na+/phosphate cotransporter Pho89 [Cephalotrichum gorgonifer]